MNELQYEWEEVEKEGTEDLFFIKVSVLYDYSPGDPGNVYGLPEDCWPPDPASAELIEVNVTSVIRIDENGNERELDLSDEDVRTYWENRFEEEIGNSDDFQEQMCLEAGESIQAGADAYAEDAYDALRDEVYF